MNRHVSKRPKYLVTALSVITLLLAGNVAFAQSAAPSLDDETIPDESDVSDPDYSGAFKEGDKVKIRLNVDATVGMALANVDGNFRGALYDLNIARQSLNSAYSTYGINSALSGQLDTGESRSIATSGAKTYAIPVAWTQQGTLSKRFLFRKLGSNLNAGLSLSLVERRTMPGATHSQETTTQTIYTVTPTLSFAYTQPITKAGIESGTASVVLAERSYTAAQLGYAYSRQTNILSAIAEYYNMSKYRHAVDIAQLKVDATNELIRIARERFKVNMIAEVDVMTLEVRLAQNEATLAYTINVRDSAMDNFFKTLGLNKLYPRSSFGSIMLEQDEDLRIPPMVLTQDECSKLAFKNRIDIQLSDISIMNARLAIQVAEVGTHPYITVSGNLDTGNSDIVFSNTFQKFQHDKSWDAQVKVTYPWLDGFATLAATTSARESLKKAQWTRNQLDDNIKRDVDTYYATVLANKVQMDILARSLDLAENSLKISEIKYSHGRKLGTDTYLFDMPSLL